MKKDIPIRPVEYMGIAIVEGENPAEGFWDVYLFNFQDIAIRNILIAVRGYGDINGKPVETATFRYFIEDLKALDYVKIEPIQTDTLALFNEYWLSFQANDYMYDKKFILPPHTVVTENLTNIPFLNKMGYMLQ